MYLSTYDMELRARQIMQDREQLYKLAALRQQAAPQSRTPLAAGFKVAAALLNLLRRSRPLDSGSPVKAAR